MKLTLAVLAASIAVGAAAAAGPLFPSVSGTDPVTGRHVALTQFRGRAVVVNFWASWCGGCMNEAKDLLFFAKAHPGLALLGIDEQDSKQGAQGFYRRYGFSHPSIFDPKYRIGSRLGIPGLPVTLFLDRNHNIVANITGAATLAQLEAGLAKARGS